mgnify:CR=1 FL=1
MPHEACASARPTRSVATDRNGHTRMGRGQGGEPHAEAAVPRSSGGFAKRASCPRIDGRALSPEQFYRRFLRANKPCILTGLTDSWGARELWRRPDGTPDVHELINGSLSRMPVPVDIGDRAEKCTVQSTLGEFASWWERRMERQRASDVTDAEASGAEGEAMGSDEPLRYLRDWHLARDCPDAAQHLYSQPEVFGFDWLNEWVAPDDYKFCYCGPRGSWTPLHFDVLCSYSWSANVVGTKRWLLFPPRVSHCLRGRTTGNAIPDARIGAAVVDGASEWPRLAEAQAACVEVLQLEGEVLFVPSGWYHQVHNEADTISINHNWMSAPALRSHLAFLKRELGTAHELAQPEYDSTPAWHDYCQKLLAARAGADVPALVRMLERFGERAEDALDDADDADDAGAAALPRYELWQIVRTLRTVLADTSEDRTLAHPMVSGWWRSEAGELLVRARRALVACDLPEDRLS